MQQPNLCKERVDAKLIFLKKRKSLELTLILFCLSLHHNIESHKEFWVSLLRVAVVIKVHLLDIQWTEMTPLTNGCAIFGSYGGLPWPLGKVSLAVVHYGSVVVRNAKTVDGTMAVLIKVVLVF